MPFVRVRGRSMLPTLRPGDFLWIGPARKVKRGDIVLVRKEELLLKRVVGLPGETISLRSSHVYVDGAPVEEPYVSPTSYLEPLPDQTIPLASSAYFVLGDARDDSLDSRRLGPVNIGQIEGVARRRLWPPTRWGRLTLFLTLLTVQPVTAAPSRLLAFASETRLVLMIGKYDTARGWVPSTNFYEPPQPGAVFSLYGPSGRVGEVRITDQEPEYRYGVFADWSAKVSSWDNRSAPYALALSGSEDLAAATLEPLPPDNAEYRGIMSRYLKSRGLNVEAPYLTQAYILPIEGHGRDAALLVAHSDASAMSTEKAGDVYAVAILWWNDHGKEKIFELASQTSHKPAGQSVEEHQKYDGVRDFLRVLCAVDIDGDGWKEIVLYRAKEDAAEIAIFHFDGRLRKVLSAVKMNFN